MCETAVPRIAPTLVAGVPVDLSRAHFVGIGGAGMLPVARVCAERGFTVSGSDARTTPQIEALARLGVRTYAGHRAGQVPVDATAVVFTHAVAEGNPEILEARERGISLVHRSTVLDALMAGRTSIAVMGTHGKSSTAGMLAFSLARMERHPSYVVGADLDGPGSGGRAGTGDLFVAEVDESDRTHIGMTMDVAVITNIAFDHPENYAWVGSHVDAYEQCIRLGLREGGTLVLNADLPECRDLTSRLAGTEGGGPQVVTFGVSPSADWRVADAATEDGRSTCVLHGPGGLEIALSLRVPGVHQLLNAAAAVAALHTAGQDLDAAVEQLGYFDGVRRRMTPAGEAAGAGVHDSYAHHPDEVRADLAAARSLAGNGGRVITVFQPTDAIRLDIFGVGFAEELAASDEVVLTDSARGIPAAALKMLSARTNASGGRARHVVLDPQEAVLHAAQMAQPGDVVVLMGAGDIAEAGPVLLQALKERASAVA
ncbi:UDP-N-acetylmuramate--L-alanine ligase [Streptomyces sp. CRPSP2-6A1]|uniref:UDP-N-acetylmuramate--L-alanine ligase n=1 Tax=Streptomyces sp. CRPSP2-6A1 TaxID=2799588 RepID=UPI0018F0F05B|nr:Mur ligase domain-containing protein [Streptomyces sp. CRPSP2-6A1]MBJ7004981.1 UDP-N-acetylmuramate--L-alanine ligase [Streptomyces sp. CRPSP2-6A1]